MATLLTDAEIDLLGPRSRAEYQAMSDADKAGFAENVRKVSADPFGAPRTEESMMRTVGLWGFMLSLAALLLGFMMTAGGNGLGLVTVFLGSGVGLFAFMWMLGAIETRLIQINNTLKSQGKADV